METKALLTAAEMRDISHENHISLDLVLDHCSNQAKCGMTSYVLFGQNTSQETLTELIKLGYSVSQIRDQNQSCWYKINWD